MNKIPLLEKFAAQSLVYVDTGLSDGKELVFSKEKFAELIVRECNEVLRLVPYNSNIEFGDESIYQDAIRKHFGVEE